MCIVRAVYTYLFCLSDPSVGSHSDEEVAGDVSEFGLVDNNTDLKIITNN